MSEHCSKYQERDAEVVDYQPFVLPKTELLFRGPKPRSYHKGNYWVALGAAQTFGCFCDKPYAALLQERLSLDVLNLGYGGAGPLFFLRHPELLSYINDAKFVVVQVMSARSEDNHLFESGGLEYLTRRSDGRKLGADASYREIIEEKASWMRFRIGIKALSYVQAIFGRPDLESLIRETRVNWVDHYEKLLKQIRAPKILFWFSKRGPQYKERYHRVGALFGGFPQLVNLEMVNQVKKSADAYTETISDRGSPQALVHRFTGKPVQVDLAKDRPDFAGSLWSHNNYYPSPQMHEDAASALEAVCRRFMNVS